jgi:hypothetical protein
MRIKKGAEKGSSLLLTLFLLKLGSSKACKLGGYDAWMLESYKNSR